MSGEIMKRATENKIIEFNTDLGPVKLTARTVKDYLVVGNKHYVTDQEIYMFMVLCKYQRLNPWIREAYLVKYSQKYPAALVTGKDVFLKRAQKQPKCKGFQNGAICYDESTSKMIYTKGIVPPNCKVLGGWAKVFVSGWEEPYEHEVLLAEYQGKKADGTINHMWETKEVTMIQKVPLSQALRTVFPSDYAGLVSPEERCELDVDALPDGSVEPPNEIEIKIPVVNGKIQEQTHEQEQDEPPQTIRLSSQKKDDLLGLADHPLLTPVERKELVDYVKFAPLRKVEPDEIMKGAQKLIETRTEIQDEERKEASQIPPELDY